MAKDPAAKKVTSAFAKRLRAVRQTGGYTQDEIAQLLGIRRDRYAKYELGLAEPPFFILMRFAELTGTSLDFLIGGKRRDNITKFIGSQFEDLPDVLWKMEPWWWKTDENHRVVEVWHLNDRVRQSGIVPRTIGKTRWERMGVDPATDEHWGRHLADLEARRPFSNFCYDKTMQSGRHQHVCVSGKPLYDDDGTFKGYCGYAFEETEGEQNAEVESA